MKNYVQTITPKKAAKYLKKNVSNRPISQRWVEILVEIMKSGEFKLNGESIKFNDRGELIDGQHRLTACVISGIPLETYVVHDLTQEAYDTIDQGKKRTLADVLARRGEKYYTCLSAAIRVVHLLELGKDYMTQSHRALRPHQLDEVLARHPEIREAVEYARTNYRKPSLLPPGVVAALYYAMRGINREKADTFFTRLYGGEGLTKNMPEYRLRQKLLENISSVKKCQPEALVAYTIKAWNLSKAGKDCTTHLRWDDREDFPVIS
jgi:hypothetical protein